MKWRYYEFLLIGGIILFSQYVYFKNELAKSTIDKDNTKALYLNLSKKQLQYIESFEYPLESNLTFKSSHNEELTLTELSTQSHLCLYIDKRHCSSCWK